MQFSTAMLPVDHGAATLVGRLMLDAGPTPVVIRDGVVEDVSRSAPTVADFMELAELMCMDALQREESCGGHFRVEHQTPDGEALRHDDQFAYVAAWESQGVGKAPILHREPLIFEYVKPSQRSYKQVWVLGWWVLGLGSR